jgi:hypothetical protein
MTIIEDHGYPLLSVGQDIVTLPDGRLWDRSVLPVDDPKSKLTLSAVGERPTDPDGLTPEDDPTLVESVLRSLWGDR